jgi:hypothetical protein
MHEQKIEENIQNDMQLENLIKFPKKARNCYCLSCPFKKNPNYPTDEYYIREYNLFKIVMCDKKLKHLYKVAYSKVWLIGPNHISHH